MKAPDRHLFVSILTSTFPMETEVAWALYDAACELHVAGGSEATLHCGAVSGKIKQANHVSLAGMCGPGFEAEVSTPKWPDGRVKFFVTHQGVEIHGAGSRGPEQVN